MKSVEIPVNNHLNHAADENTLWRAVLYAMGEGTAEDRAKFEDQLGFDEALCDALVEATRLLELTSMGLQTSKLSYRSESSTEQLSASRGFRRPVTAIAGTTAAVLFALGLAVATSSDSISDAELVTQMLHNAATEEDSEADSSMNEVNDWSGEIETPQWLLTALELEDSDNPTDEALPVPDDSI